MNTLFTYGTLRRGNEWHHLLSQSPRTRFVGAGTTRDKLPLIIGDDPFLFDVPGTGHRVKGEVFVVDDETLAAVDRLEGHPDWYRRKPIAIELADGGSITAWAYFAIGGHEQSLLRTALAAGAGGSLVDEFKP